MAPVDSLGLFIFLNIPCKYIGNNFSLQGWAVAHHWNRTIHSHRAQATDKKKKKHTHTQCNLYTVIVKHVATNGAINPKRIINVKHMN